MIRALNQRISEQNEQVKKISDTLSPCVVGLEVRMTRAEEDIWETACGLDSTKDEFAQDISYAIANVDDLRQTFVDSKLGHLANIQ